MLWQISSGNSQWGHTSQLSLCYRLHLAGNVLHCNSYGRMASKFSCMDPPPPPQYQFITQSAKRACIPVQRRRRRVFESLSPRSEINHRYTADNVERQWTAFLSCNARRGAVFWLVRCTTHGGWKRRWRHFSFVVCALASWYFPFLIIHHLVRSHCAECVCPQWDCAAGYIRTNKCLRWNCVGP